MGRERRKYGRYPCRLRVRFGTATELKDHYISNVAEGGVFVETLYPLDIGKRVTLEIFVGDDVSPLTVQGEVIWIRRFPEEGPPGMGIRFLEMSLESREKLGRILHGVDDNPYHYH